MTRPQAAIAGSLAQRLHAGGHSWVFLQYLLGLRRLDWDVLFVDWLDPKICAGPVERSVHARYLESVMARFGLEGDFSLLDRTDGHVAAGLPRDELVRRIQGSEFLLNIMGYLDDEELLAAAKSRVFLDIDPGFPQMWRELGLANLFDSHDDFATIGERVGRAGCLVPTCGLDWIVTRPPVVLELWPRADESGRRAFTSVVTWRGPFGPIDYGGQTYGLRVHEFRKFAELPRRAQGRFELALDIHPGDERDRALLEANGWQLVDPKEVAGDPGRYRSYVADSFGELMIAKNMYVETRSGWFSDRSACYLASGRPVLAQDTGLEELFPLGAGLIAFSTLEEAVAGVETLVDDYERHASAARELAEEHFDSDRVLRDLLRALRVS